MSTGRGFKRRFDGIDIAESLITISDVLPATDASDSLGSSTKRYKNATFSGTVTAATSSVTGLTASAIVQTTAGSVLTASNTLTQNLTVSGTNGYSGVSSFTNSTNATSISTGAVKLSGGLSLAANKDAYFGGVIDVTNPNSNFRTGSGSTTALNIVEGTGTSKRAGINLGSAWQFVQDTATNGTKDFAIYDITNGRSLLASDTSDNITASGIMKVGAFVAQNNGMLKLATSSTGNTDTWWIGFDAGTNYADSNDRARIAVQIKAGGNGSIYMTTGAAGAQTQYFFLDDSGVLTLAGTTDATTTATGTLVLGGGLGVAKTIVCTGFVAGTKTCTENAVTTLTIADGGKQIYCPQSTHNNDGTHNVINLPAPTAGFKIDILFKAVGDATSAHGRLMICNC